MVRPHVGLTVFAGLVLAALLYTPHKASPLNPIVRVITFGILFVMMILLVSETEKFLGVEQLNQETVNTELGDAEGRTSKDDVGSVFTPVRVNTPIDVPFATVTVLFRPFPWETHNAQATATAFEGMFIVYLMIKGRRRLMALPRALRRESYTAFCLGVMFTFIYAFSAFSNFGILARQRVQVMPFFLALICLNEVKKRDKRAIMKHPDIEALATPAEDPYARFESPAEDAPVEAEAETTGSRTRAGGPGRSRDG